MAVFTMRLKDALGNPQDLDACYARAHLIGLADYPIYDESLRGPLNRKIIDRFLNREIGQETVEMFAHAMRRRMHEIMPTYNQLYASERLKIDPLLTMDIRTVTANESTSDSTADSGNKSSAVTYDMPQNRLKGDRDYASGAQDVGAESKAVTAAKEAGKVDSHVTGIQGSQAALLMAYRETFLNIDLAIIEELEASNLFMLLWDNNDDATRRSNPIFGGYYYGF